MSLLFFLCTIVINLWLAPEIRHSRCIAVFVNKQHDIQRKQDFDKKFIFREVHSKEVDRQIF